MLREKIKLMELEPESLGRIETGKCLMIPNPTPLTNPIYFIYLN